MTMFPSSNSEQKLKLCVCVRERVCVCLWHWGEEEEKTKSDHHSRTGWFTLVLEHARPSLHLLSASWACYFQRWFCLVLSSLEHPTALSVACELTHEGGWEWLLGKVSVFKFISVHGTLRGWASRWAIIPGNTSLPTHSPQPPTHIPWALNQR